MARRIKVDLDELAEAIDDAIQSRINSGEIVVHGPRGGHEEDDDFEDDEEGSYEEAVMNGVFGGAYPDDGDDDDDFLDLPQHDFSPAAFDRHARPIRQDNPLVARLQGRKVKLPVYNSDDDDDDVLDLPQYDNAAFGRW